MYLPQEKRQHRSGPVAEHGEQARQPVIFTHKHRIYGTGRQQSGHAQIVVDTEDPVALLIRAGKIQDAYVQTGKPGAYHAEHQPLGQKTAEAAGLPEHDFGKKIQPAA